MAYILTGAVRVSGVYKDENGTERRYTIVRGQSVASLGLPAHVENELLSRTRPQGGRRGNPIPYFTNVGEGGKVVALDADSSVDMASYEAARHKSRVEAGAVKATDEPTEDIPQPDTKPDGWDADPKVETPEDAAELVSEEEVAEESVPEEVASEPVVSPTEEDASEHCSNPDCTVKGDTNACEDDNCPVNEAPAEATEEVAAKKPAAKKSSPKKPAAKKTRKRAPRKKK